MNRAGAGEETARALAQALDVEDYQSAATLLSQDCRYNTGLEVLRGPEAIIHSYREAGEWGRANLDQVGYRSEVRTGSDGRFVVTYFDDIRHASREHTYSCEQLIRLDNSGKVVEIEHRELLGEREALNQFFKAVNVKPRGG